MKKAQITPILIAVSFLFITAWCQINAPASVTLTNISLPSWAPNAGGGWTGNSARGISPDGKYVIGVCSPADAFAGFLCDVASTAVRWPNGGGSVPSVLTGIAYRTDTNQVPEQLQLILDGMSAGYQANWMTADGGLTWGAKRRDVTFTAANVQPVANSLGATTGSDAFYPIIRGSSDTQLYTLLGVGQWDAILVPTMTYVAKGTASDPSAMLAVAATGRAVGYRKVSGTAQNYVLDYPPASGTAFFFNGMDDTLAGEVWSISLDGSIVFGRSYTDPFSRPGLWPYKAVLTTNVPGSSSSLISIDELPSFPDTAGSSSLGVPYACTADGNYAVGMSYRGAEKAVLWDTSDADTNAWTVLDLSQLAQVGGNLDIFLELTRAYGVATNAAGKLVITGHGADTSLTTRAFVMTIPLPITPALTISNSGGGFTLNYLGFGNKTNVLEYTTDLNLPHTWTPLDTNTTGNVTAYVDAAPADVHRFYRVVSE